MTGTSDYQLDFALEGHSIWGPGDATMINKSYFTGLDIYESGTLGHIDLQAGLQTDVAFNTGSLDSYADYGVDYTAYRNYATDMVALDFDNTYGGARFTTETFTGEISLDAVLDIDAYFGVKVGTVEIGLGVDESDQVDILTLNQDTSVSVSKTFPTKIPILELKVGASLAWPDTSTDSGYAANASLSTSDNETFAGASLSAIVGKSVKFVGIEGYIELMELGMSYEAALAQSFRLYDQAFSGVLELEDGSTMNIAWADDMIFHDVSTAYDSDGDGILEFSSDFGLDAKFSNNTDIDFTYGPFLEALSAGFKVPVIGSVEFGPLISDSWDFEQTLDVYDNTFAVNYTGGDGFDMLIA